jgi:ubiquinone/menaquinone biosynthesis C-methylase UbiE
MKETMLLSKNSTTYGNYEEYLEAQTSIGLSYESENYIWRDGQERYVKKMFSDLPRDIKIADIACGDGVGLECFKNLNFTSVEGFELSPDKAERARKYKYPIHEGDIHDLSFIEDEYYDIIYSSHTLEHLLDPLSVLSQFKRILKKNGDVYVVLPYGSETVIQREHWVHCGVENLSLDIEDGGETLKNKIQDIGFTVVDKKFDEYRESEIWLKLKL